MIAAASVLAVVAAGCDEFKKDTGQDTASSLVGLDQVAEILAMIPLNGMHLDEVHHAVLSSTRNGYDEEYTMRDLFTSPGTGVGEHQTRSTTEYPNPLRDLIEDYVYSSYTKSVSGEVSPEEFLSALMESDIQIYWPFSEEWDGETLPIVTFDPEDGSVANVGYKLMVDDDGYRYVQEIVVDEEMAEDVPVWVVNRNSDAGFTSLEILRREDPQWGEGGGNIIVHPKGEKDTKAGKTYKALVLKDFTMRRNYDSWFAGASEFFVLTITGGCSFA